MANTKITSNVIADGAITESKLASGVGGVAGIVSSADATAITIDSSENVGIGTTNPSSGGGLLNLETSSSSVVNYNSTNANGGFIKFQRSGTTKGYVGTPAAFLGGGDADDFGIRAQADFTIATGGTNERMRILSSGGITFNGDTATANALDDYEEGTHTATITPTGGSITVNSSVDELGYVKIGRQVTVTGMLTVGSVSSPTGYFNISLPFSIGSWASTYGNRCTGSIWVNPKTGGGNVADYIVYGIQGESQFRVYLGDATSIQADSAQTLYGTVDIILSITYITN